MRTFTTLLRRFGFNGLKIYSQLKFNSQRVLIPGSKIRVALRKDTPDKKVFKQILVHDEYKFDPLGNVSVIIDAGANIGLASIYFSKVYPTAKVIAIEADQENFNQLKKNTLHFPQIKPLNAGLWHRPGTLAISNPGYLATGFMVKEVEFKSGSTLKAISLNQIIQEHALEKIDILKIDVEGAEKEILSENTEWLGKVRIIILELHDRKKEGCSESFFSAFSRHKFECHPFGQNFLLINRDTPSIKERRGF